MAALSVESRKLLERVVAYYQHTLSADSKGLIYLRDKLEVHFNPVIEDCRIGYSDGSLIDTLPEDPAVISKLTRMGILEKGKRDSLESCLVVPLTDASGDIINLHAINLRTHRSRLLNKTRAGILNHRAFLVFDTVVVAPTVTDFLFLYDRSVQNCAYVYCVETMESAGAFYGSKSLKQVFLIRFKKANQKSCHKGLQVFLKEKGLATHTISIPFRCAAAYFKEHTLENFQALVKSEKERIARLPKEESGDPLNFERTLEGFTCTAGGNRKYEIKGIRKRATRFQITIKASMEQGGSTPFELSTVDMYSYRARVWFARLCADLFAVSEDFIQKDLRGILDFAENLQTDETVGRVQLNDDEKKEAIAFLSDPHLLERILGDFEAIGVVGEKTNKLVGYLAAVSRKLEEPLSVLIQSRSAAGKSTLQDGILSLMPPEDVLKYTRITDQALFYSGENTFAHKILAIEEGPGMKGAAYSIRNIQSSGKITVAATGKGRGDQGLKTTDYTVKGPVAVMLTTTATALDEETASRFIVLTIDESDRMTRAIHEQHRRGESLNGVLSKKTGQRIVHRHHNAQRLLKPLLVVNPYAAHLSYPSAFLKARRDFRKYLGLIKAIAFLHQYQRDRQTVSIDGRDCEYIEVSVSDIERANTLAAEVLGQSLDDLPVSSRQLLKLIYKMVKALAEERGLPVAKISITRRMIREHTGWSHWQVRNYLPPLLDFEYLIVEPHSRVNRYSFAVNTGENNKSVYWAGLQLTPASELKRKIDALDKRGRS